MARMTGWILGFGLILAGAWFWWASKTGPSNAMGRESQRPIPVEVRPVMQGEMVLRRLFAGTLESRTWFDVAPKVGGRITRLFVDLGDPVENAQVVAELDAEEYELALVQAQADLEVSRANLIEAQSHLELAQREVERMTSLQAQGVTTDAEMDTAQAQHLARQAAVEVSRSRVTRAEAAVSAAEVRLSYTRVTANWSGGGRRFVAERHMNVGGTITANSPLFTIVELDPITAVVYVTEKDYGLLQVGQIAELTTDAFPRKVFSGQVARVAPSFDEGSRQARVEIRVANPGQQLKPGMFAGVEVLLDRAERACSVPLAALTRRDDSTGVFGVNEPEMTAVWLPVKPGFQEGDRIQIVSPPLSGQVVTVGHQFIEHGSIITIPNREHAAPAQPRSSSSP